METTKSYSRRKNTYVVTELEKIQKSFLWENSTSKIKHDTLCNDYKYGGLKNVDIRKRL